ncbi:MAG: hypothetical protein ACXV2C_07970 [Candidatus Bathyarchaeia archaeon]
MLPNNRMQRRPRTDFLMLPWVLGSAQLMRSGQQHGMVYSIVDCQNPVFNNVPDTISHPGRIAAGFEMQG